MQIEWPDLPEIQWEKPNAENVQNDAFFRDVVKVETASDGTMKIRIDMDAEIQLVPSVVAELKSLRRPAAREIAELIVQRMLIDINLALLPLLIYRLNEHLQKGN